ncbi:hypothetical protein E4U41_001325 [Claviceps citrina]|nr:hypothetical protein E4U41_001325 [Claviceps citrina]
MALAVAHKSPSPARQGFAFFDDGSPASKDTHTSDTVLTAAPVPDVLRELSKGRSQSRAVSAIDIAASPTAKSPRRESPRLETKPAKCQAVRLTPRAQRPQAHAETFEPLVAVPEESNSLVEAGEAVAASSPARAGEDQATSSQSDAERQMRLTAEANLSLEGQIEKHLAGQFEWILTYPTGAGSRATGDCIAEPGQRRPSTVTVYGCNVLPLRRQQRATPSSAETSTDMFTLIATTLAQDSSYYPSTTEHRDMTSSSPGHLCQRPPLPNPGMPLQTSKATTEVEQAVPRIEDSFEELDRLEDELEAVHQVTRTRQHVAGQGKSVQASPGGSSTNTPTSKVNKRVSIAGCSATVRVKPSQEKPPALRRSASLTLRDKRASQQGSSSDGPRVGAMTLQSLTASSRVGAPKLSAKSSKPPTVPKFELPGEAVARRLKEQREARLAQQAEALKAQAPPAPKPRSNKLLPRPTFELPGEAISRRKREELEAKLRAEEEEARKRREFKARPVRQSIGPATAPRETLTSRARQNKPLAETNGDAEARQKRLRVGARVSLTNNSSHTRGRTSGSATTENARATSASTCGGGGGKRNSVSLEELTVQRQRGREILNRDNSFMQERKKDKQEREMTTKTAREQAAERSRIASREWAEKKQRKEMGGRQAKENQDGQNGLQA